jgi:hypothetical protein
LFFNSSFLTIQAAQALLKTEHFHHYRGLEHLSSQKLCLARGMTVLNATTEILLEQVNTKLLGGGEPGQDPDERMARLYAASNQPAARYARIVALADAAAAGYSIPE